MRATLHVEPEAARRNQPAIIMRLDDGTVTRHRQVHFDGPVDLLQRPEGDTAGVKVWIEADTSIMTLGDSSQ